MATEFQKASKGKIVSDTPAMQEFERIREEASIEAAAQRAGKSPEEIKAEAKAAGTDLISWIKDKYPTPEAQKKTANRAPAEPVADEIPKTPGKLESLKKEIQAGTYNPIKGIAEGLGVEEEAVPKTVAQAVKEKKKAEAAPTVQEVPKTVAEQVKSGAAIKKEQGAIRGAITSAPQFAIITAESPRGKSVPGGNEALRKELEAKGYKFEQMEGMYGGKENPFLVQTDKLSDIRSLGKKYGQESVILADNNKYKMQFTSGPQEGQFYTANTITQYATPPKDYYSTVVRDGKPVHFSIDFDMEKLKGKPVPPTSPKAPAQALAKASAPTQPTGAEQVANADRREQTEGVRKLLIEQGVPPQDAVKQAETVVAGAEKAASKTGSSLKDTLQNLVRKVISENPKTAFAAALVGLASAGLMATKEKDATTPPSLPTPPAEKKKESVEPPAAVVKTVKEGDDTLTEFEKYKQKMSLTETEKEKFTGIEGRLKDSLDSAKDAYSKGMRSTELYKAFEKIAEGLALYGAGLYGKKSGLDAVSGLKFSPIDWSTRTDRLTKELDMADKSYTKGMEITKEEKRGIEKLRGEAVKFDEGRKEREEKRAERLSTKEVATQEKGVKGQKDILERQIKALGRQIDEIEKVRTSTPKSGDAMERQYQALATTLGIPKEEYMTGMLGGFRENSADAAFLKKQQELVAQRSQLEKQLSGESVVSQPGSGGVRTAEEEERKILLEAKEKAAVK
jgi:hypothetical protein